MAAKLTKPVKRVLPPLGATSGECPCCHQKCPDPQTGEWTVTMQTDGLLFKRKRARQSFLLPWRAALNAAMARGPHR